MTAKDRERQAYAALDGRCVAPRCPHKATGLEATCECEECWRYWLTLPPEDRIALIELRAMEWPQTTTSESEANTGGVS